MGGRLKSRTQGPLFMCSWHGMGAAALAPSCHQVLPPGATPPRSVRQGARRWRWKGSSHPGSGHPAQVREHDWLRAW